MGKFGGEVWTLATLSMRLFPALSFTNERAPKRGGTSIFYDVNGPDTVLGGLILSGCINNANFYVMVEVFLIFDSSYILRYEDSTDIQRDEQALRPGNYYIITTGRMPYATNPRQIGSFSVNNEVPLLRTISVNSGTRVGAFRDGVRDRDRHTGLIMVSGEALRLHTSFQQHRAANEEEGVRVEYVVFQHDPSTGGGKARLQNSITQKDTG